MFALFKLFLCYQIILPSLLLVGHASQGNFFLKTDDMNPQLCYTLKQKSFSLIACWILGLRITRTGGYAAMKTILIVEDDDSTATFLTLAIAQETSYQVLHATTGVRALEIVRHIKAGLFIIDYLLPDMNGIVLYDYLHA